MPLYYLTAWLLCLYVFVHMRVCQFKQFFDGCSHALAHFYSMVSSTQVNNTFTGAYIPTGVTDEGLQRYLAPWKAVRTLELRHFIPGTFGGFTSSHQAAAVDDAVFPLFADKSWCCSGEQPMPANQLQWPYALPARLSSRVQEPGTLVAPGVRHKVPSYTRPEFCDGIKDDPKNSKFLQYPNHPCTYLALPFNFPGTVPDVLALAN